MTWSGSWCLRPVHRTPAPSPLSWSGLPWLVEEHALMPCHAGRVFRLNGWSGQHDKEIQELVFYLSRQDGKTRVVVKETCSGNKLLVWKELRGCHEQRHRSLSY